ncbi:phage tail protein [Edaphobacter dinghuensis]|uniref:Tail Collar domain-containing protein n=1 Tax=Edaphobacter dinghuensis TaxID=1560005 RepID=A0A917HNB9_9BACT|nr:tail fiber protein [Edaphobacter dinghuensis]GGG83914.1 tail Collar domain-containing protein [Edaphobacter dinghuensis]
MSEPFLGEIRMVGWNFAANGWALCNGQLLSISQYTALFSLLGTYYGGDGRQTFALPNLQGRVPIHQGTGLGLSTYDIGEVGGNENITLLSTQMPQHNHLVGVSNLPGSVADPTNAVLAQGNSGSGRSPVLVTDYVSTSATGTLAPATISMAGGSQPHSNIQPFLCINFIIALTGIFPTRS